MARKPTSITFPSSLYNGVISRADTPTEVTTFKAPADVNKSNFIASMAKAGKSAATSSARALRTDMSRTIVKDDSYGDGHICRQVREGSKLILELDADTWAESGGTAGVFGSWWKKGALRILPSVRAL